MKDNPSIYDGKSLSAVTPAVEGNVEDGTPYGSISGVVYRNIPSILKKTYSTPYPVICIPDLPKKYYAMMRCALACDITFIICPSPSNLLRFHQTVMESSGDLVKDIHDGTLRADVAGQLPAADRHEILAGFTPDPQRAKALENRVEDVYREAVAYLFSGAEDIHHVVQMLKLREVYRHLSNAADSGDEAANVIADIVVKLA
jgi:hypothetical protein